MSFFPRPTTPSAFLGIMVLVGGMLVGAGTPRVDAEDKPPVGFIADYIGYHHGGDGVIEDATPVDEWRDYVYKKGKRKRSSMEPDLSTTDQAVNIVWKVPHFNWCNGGMILVDGKLYALADRGGMGFNDERQADFLGVKLFCYDPADGKELWTRDLQHWDLVPNGDQLAETLKEYNSRIVKVYPQYLKIYSNLIKKSKQATDEEYLSLIDPLRDLAAKPFPKTWAEARKQKAFQSKGYNQTTWVSRFAPEYFPDLKKARGMVEGQGGYLKDPWFLKDDFLGINMQTPVSDGEHIWIATGFGAVFCVDLDGQVVWKKWFGKGFERGWAIPSPVLHGDTLVVCAAGKGDIRLALDKHTGDELWRSNEVTYSHYQQGPSVFSLPIAGDESKRLEALLYQDGDVVRLSDGKRLATGLGGMATARPWACEGRRVVGIHRAQDGGRYKAPTKWQDKEKDMLCFELSAPSADQVEATLCWTQQDRYKFDTMIAHDGLLYHATRDGGLDIRSLDDGSLIAKAKGGRGDSFHRPVLAGRHFITLNTDGVSAVFDVGADGRNPKLVGQGRLHEPKVAMFNYGAQHLVSGNRIFIRSNRHLWCIGDPKQPLQLSAIHAAGGKP